ALQELSNRIMVTGGLLVDRDQPLKLKQQRDTVAQKLRETLNEVQEFGCVVKDLDIGLLDFPTLFRGREVYLCWKLGGASISYWQGVDEGFAGRKEIDQEFREHHRGDRPQEARFAGSRNQAGRPRTRRGPGPAAEQGLPCRQTTSLRIQ